MKIKDAILKIKNLNVEFPLFGGILNREISHVHAVKSLSLNVERGKTVGIVGESGSGKTTLGMAVLRLIKSSGEINFFQKKQKLSINKFDFKQMKSLRSEIQVVFQDPFGSLSPRLSIKEIIGEGLEIHKKDLTEKDREKLILDFLQFLYEQLVFLMLQYHQMVYFLSNTLKVLHYANQDSYVNIHNL